MKIYQTHTAIRMMGIIFLIMGLGVICLLFVGLFLGNGDYEKIAVCLVFGSVFSMVGYACFHSDFIILGQNEIEYFESTLFSHKIRVIAKSEVLGFKLKDAEIVGKRNIRDGKELILSLKDGSEILIKEANSLSGQAGLLSIVKKYWKNT